MDKTKQKMKKPQSKAVRLMLLLTWKMLKKTNNGLED